ncbi:MAG: hypothetical protein OHK0029_05070 [Armatimonadaceae bacterium]
MAERREQVWKEWREHNDRLRPLLSTDLIWVLDFLLDDAQVYLLHINPQEQTLSLGLYAGDSERGYFKLDYNYSGVTITEQEIQLLCRIVHDIDNEIAWDELHLNETENGPVYSHRICWHTSIRTGMLAEDTYSTLQPEIEIRFTGFSMTKTPFDDVAGEQEIPDIQIIRNPDVIEGLY